MTTATTARPVSRMPEEVIQRCRQWLAVSSYPAVLKYHPRECRIAAHRTRVNGVGMVTCAHPTGRGPVARWPESILQHAVCSICKACYDCTEWIPESRKAGIRLETGR